MYKTEDDHLNWCLFSKVQVEELCRQTEKLFSDSTKRWGNGLIYAYAEYMILSVQSITKTKIEK